MMHTQEWFTKPNFHTLEFSLPGCTGCVCWCDFCGCSVAGMYQQHRHGLIWALWPCILFSHCLTVTRSCKNIESKLCLATWQKMCWVFDPFALHNTKQTFTQRKQWKTKKSKRSIFTILTGLFHSRLPYIIDHHKHLRCFIHLYNRMTTQVLAFL